jgi:hypothetical protein
MPAPGRSLKLWRMRVFSVTVPAWRGEARTAPSPREVLEQSLASGRGLEPAAANKARKGGKPAAAQEPDKDKRWQEGSG